MPTARPQLINDFITLILTLERGYNVPMTTDRPKSYAWLDLNKFRVGGWDYGYLITEESASTDFDFQWNLMTEDGNTLVGDGGYTYYPGPEKAFFDSYTFLDFDPNDNINYIKTGLVIDFSCSIDQYFTS